MVILSNSSCKTKQYQERYFSVFIVFIFNDWIGFERKRSQNVTFTAPTIKE